MSAADARPAVPADAADAASTADARPESCVKYFDALWFCYCECVCVRE